MLGKTLVISSNLHIRDIWVSGIWEYHAIGFERFVITLGGLGHSFYTRRFLRYRFNINPSNPIPAIIARINKPLSE